jgi:hypothetical protein
MICFSDGPVRRLVDAHARAMAALQIRGVKPVLDCHIAITLETVRRARLALLRLNLPVKENDERTEQ